MPLLVLGEYGAKPLDLRSFLVKVIPVPLISMASAVLLDFQPLEALLVSFAGISIVWLWRRLYYWFQYFRSVFSRKRCRSLLLGNHREVATWFKRENIVVGRDILGCVSQNGAGDARIHFLGGLESLQDIQLRTGAKEILVVPDSHGRHESIPDSGVLGPKFRTQLLVGHPDTSTFAMVDLHFLK